jgi:hypothetical protein
MKRHKTTYPGMFYREVDRIGGNGLERVYYIIFKKDGKVFEEKVGRQYADDMTLPVPGGIVRTDDWSGYRGLVRHGYIHDVVRKDASIGENLLPLANRVIALLKRWLLGIHQGLYKYLILITAWMHTPSDLIAGPHSHEENSSIAWFNKPFLLSRLRAIQSLAE